VDILEHALAYAELGWEVFPLAGKVPLIKGGEGLYDGTSDVKQIRQWFDKKNPPNIGLRTGTHFDVIDFDHFPDGSIMNYKTPMARTGKGFHVLIQPTGYGNRAALKGKHPGELIDFRGNGGYIVAPPSAHPDFGIKPEVIYERYKWVQDFRMPLMKPTERMLALIKPPERKVFEPKEHTGPYNVNWVAEYFLAHAQEGSRNHTLNEQAYRLGGHYRDGRCTSDELETARYLLLDAALAAGLTEHESEKTIASGIRSAMS
jgi:hypothetical protein